MNPFENCAFPVIETVSNCRLKLDDRDDKVVSARSYDGLTLSRVTPDNSNIADLIEEAPLDEDTVKFIDRMIDQKGQEVLAYYKSPHLLNNLNFPGKWGIFIFTWALRYVAANIRSFHPNPWSRVVTQAYQFLCAHERYHWYVDAWTIEKEALLKTSLYEDYLNSVYRPHFPSGCFEEALASRNARDSMQNEGISAFMDSFMNRQPAMFSQYGRDKNELCSHLAGQIIDRPLGEQAFTHQRPELAPWLAASSSSLLDDENCPIYLIHERGPAIRPI